jgi:hypothetical protein
MEMTLWVRRISKHAANTEDTKRYLTLEIHAHMQIEKGESALHHCRMMTSPSRTHRCLSTMTNEREAEH